MEDFFELIKTPKSVSEAPKEFKSKNYMSDKEIEDLINTIDKNSKTIPLSPEKRSLYTDKNNKQVTVDISKMDRRKKSNKSKSKRKTTQRKVIKRKK